MYVIFSTILLYLSQVSNKVLCNQHLHFGCTVSNSDFLWYSFLATENQWCAHCTLVFTKQQVSNHHLLSNTTLLYKEDRWYVLHILSPKLLRKNCSSYREKLLKLEAECREFAKTLRSLEQIIITVIMTVCTVVCSQK